ncbi:hypothetical protein C4D60_Mb10t06710 [Musa balbisiana]|uniref:Calcineurin-like phosphoesterase domain-containing protein n=1 Tax=Musa balbisiana TaxID=52838 RepID=A0A4S8IV96_MUSBA|nr:hypothetical protein C4D60_Mb10t06710 [Musa balbisiana]
MLRASAVGPSRNYSAASPLLLFFASPFSTTASATASSVASTVPNRFAMSRPLRIAVVGDVHDYWELEEDSKALHFLQVILEMRMLNLLEAFQVLSFQKQQFWGTMIAGLLKSFQRNEHVGYCRLDFPMLKLCVLGGRPFSCGGDRLFRPKLLSSRYGVSDMEQSAKKIYEAALGTPEGHSVIVLAHNGPTGLGSKVSDICGRDWIFGGGDHGDPDLAQAISDLQRDTQIPIPLVIFGHMHKALAYGNGLRKMIAVGADNTIYLNAAIVPRVKHILVNGSGSSMEEQNQFETSENGTVRAFTIVEFLDGQVEKIMETWVLVAGEKIELDHENITEDSDG